MDQEWPFYLDLAGLDCSHTDLGSTERDLCSSGTLLHWRVIKLDAELAQDSILKGKSVTLATCIVLLVICNVALFLYQPESIGMLLN